MQNDDENYYYNHHYNNNHKPPRPPPLSVSLPSTTRPEPDPIPPPKPKPKLIPNPKIILNSNPKPTSTTIPSATTTTRSTLKAPSTSATNSKVTFTGNTMPSSTGNTKSASTTTSYSPTSTSTTTAEHIPAANPKVNFTGSAKSTSTTANYTPTSTSTTTAKHLPASATSTDNKRTPTIITTNNNRPAPTIITTNHNPKLESQHSPLRSDSPTRSDDPDLDDPKQSSNSNETSLVPHEKFYSPLTSPLPVTPPKDAASEQPPSQDIINFNRREDSAVRSGVVFSGGGERKERGLGGSAVGSVVTRSRKEEVVKKIGLGIRVLEIVFCLVSFSVMAADKTQGWSGDSFDRYKEYRFCLTVAIFGFVYSAFQAYDLGSHIATGKHVISHRLRYHFDFIMDQILAYLLISASSAAASRVDDWQANWGKDEFTKKASASISMAFLAFICFAMSSLFSGYNFCNRDLY